jgi:predicted dehydrogenase
VRPGPLDFALVGAGGIAQSWAEAFAGCDGAAIAGVVDPRLDLARALAEPHDCPAFADYEVMLDDVDCDAALICTPPSTHAEIALAFLERGVSVLCEKPLALDTASATKMLDVAEGNDAILAMAAKFRYVTDVVQARAIVHSGILGEIVLFENVFAARVPMASRWNSVPEISGGGVLIDNGTHAVDVARYFLGPIQEVLAVEGKRVQTLDVEDTARLFIVASDGTHGTIDLSWTIDKQAESYIEIFGSEGTIRVGWRESRFRRASSPDWVRFGSGYDKIDAMRRQLADFCGAVHGTHELLITPEDALASVAAIEAAYESMRRNHWSRVADRDGSW